VSLLGHAEARGPLAEGSLTVYRSEKSQATWRGLSFMTSMPAHAEIGCKPPVQGAAFGV